MALQKNPLIARAINGKQFFVFECVVWSNRYANDFADNTLTQQQIEHLCSFREGVAVCLDVKGTENLNGQCHTLDFFHHTFFDNLETVQFWTIHHINKLSGIKKYLDDISIKCCTAVTSVYVNKLMGDAAQLGILVGFYQQFMGIATEQEILLQYQECEISTSQLQDEPFLKSNDPSFKLFTDVVDNTVKCAITSIYGNFSEFTEPIITQSMLRDMENAFRTILVTKDSEGTNGNLRSIELAPDFRSRYVMLVGDGLSQIRAKTFEK